MAVPVMGPSSCFMVCKYHSSVKEMRDSEADCRLRQKTCKKSLGQVSMAAAHYGKAPEPTEEEVPSPPAQEG